ncbi:MAG: FG-GAP-like repeat-containing protein, partial [Phycisphaerae bacterium]
MDWNNDGRKDLITGERNGYIRIYLNVGTDAGPAFSGYSFLQVGGSTFDCGFSSMPEIVDWNNDGRKDVLCGDDTGYVRLLINVGTDASPAFSTAAYVYNGASLLYAGSRASPAVADWDGDGRKDLLVGNTNGTICYFRNVGTDAAPVFNGYELLTAGGSTLDVAYYSRFDVADWNNDGRDDVICGCYDYPNTGKGQIWYFRRSDTDPPVVVDWRSASEHGEGVGEVLLEVADDGGFCEPRLGGVSRLAVEFSEPIDPASFTPASVRLAGNDARSMPVDLSGIAVSTSTAKDGTVGVIDFAPALPNVARYLVQIEGVTDAAGNPLEGDNNRVFTALAGDANGDLRVNAIDLSYIWPRRTSRIDGAAVDEARSDVNCDGRVNAIDLSAAWPRRGSDMRNVSDPVLPPLSAAEAPSGEALSAAARLLAAAEVGASAAEGDSASGWPDTGLP